MAKKNRGRKWRTKEIVFDTYSPVDKKHTHLYSHTVHNKLKINILTIEISLFSEKFPKKDYLYVYFNINMFLIKNCFFFFFLFVKQFVCGFCTKYEISCKYIQ